MTQLSLTFHSPHTGPRSVAFNTSIHMVIMAWYRKIVKLLFPRRHKKTNQIV